MTAGLRAGDGVGLGIIDVVVEGGTIAACTGVGTIIPACLRTASSSATMAASPATNPERLPASEARVKTHLLRAFQKLAMSDLTAAVTTAMPTGLLD